MAHVVFLMEVHPGVHGKGVAPEPRSLASFSLDENAFRHVNAVCLGEETRDAFDSHADGPDRRKQRVQERPYSPTHPHDDNGVIPLSCARNEGRCEEAYPAESVYVP